MKTFHKISKNTIKRLFELEKMGKYDEIFAEVESIWTDRTKLPDVENLEPHLAAEVILRCGSLIGFLGQYKQLPNAQEKSKNLLIEARNRFLDLYNVEKIAECENYMALAYWRSGELNEADDWIKEAFSHKIIHSSSTRLHTFIIESMIYLSAKKYPKVLERLETLELMFLKFADNSLKGSFYNNLGVAYECLGEISSALTKLEKGKHFHFESGNEFQYAVAENNLSMLYKAQNNFSQAHKSSDNSARIFKKLKDRTREGFALDTKAQIYLAENKFDEALETVEKAIRIIKLSENASFITETYLTKTKTLIHLDNISGATACLFEAVELAKIQSGEKAAENLIREFEVALREKFEKNNAIESANEVTEFADKNGETDELQGSNDNLQLILPVSISHYKEIQAVQIRNTHFEHAGLEKNSLAIVANTEIRKGDLAAIIDLKTDSVNFGFYEEDFGIICLENQNSEPMLFDVENVEVLGKIIGVGKNENESGNKVVVKSLI